MSINIFFKPVAMIYFNRVPLDLQDHLAHVVCLGMWCVYNGKEIASYLTEE